MKHYLVAQDVLSLPAQDAGIQKGIIRVHLSHIGQGKFHRWQPVVVSNPNTNRSIIRFVLGASQASPIFSPTAIQLDYDARLDLEHEETHLLNVTPARWYSLYAWYWRHPDPGYRVAMQLAMVSIGLGVVGLALGILSLIF